MDTYHVQVRGDEGWVSGLAFDEACAYAGSLIADDRASTVDVKRSKDGKVIVTLTQG